LIDSIGGKRLGGSASNNVQLLEVGWFHLG
jgi:hypothetical protein